MYFTLGSIHPRGESPAVLVSFITLRPDLQRMLLGSTGRMMTTLSSTSPIANGKYFGKSIVRIGDANKYSTGILVSPNCELPCDKDRIKQFCSVMVSNFGDIIPSEQPNRFAQSIFSSTIATILSCVRVSISYIHSRMFVVYL